MIYIFCNISHLLSVRLLLNSKRDDKFSSRITADDAELTDLTRATRDDALEQRNAVWQKIASTVLP